MRQNGRDDQGKCLLLETVSLQCLASTTNRMRKEVGANLGDWGMDHVHVYSKEG